MPPTVGYLAIYILIGRAIMQGLAGKWRSIAFAILNVVGFYVLFFHGQHNFFVARFGLYIALVVLQYGALRIWGRKNGWWPWIAFYVPIAALVVFRYVPSEIFVALGHAFGKSFPGVPSMVGISYMAFRCSHLVLEVRNGTVKMPGLCDYISFCLFVPTVPVGPINPYSNFLRGFDPTSRPPLPIGRALLRILVGIVKYQFLGSLCNRLSYSGLLLDEHFHPWVDLSIAMVFYYLFLYCNFSGFIDVAIGAAGLIGIPVAENFDSPLSSRNMREFWNRWHITLSQYMRDVVFAPLSKCLTRILGPQNVNHAIGISVFVVFLLIGIWHGAGWNYALFGLAQAVGVVVVHYYTIWLKRRLGAQRFKAYNANRWIRSAAVALTFCYYAATLFFFANTMDEMKTILSVLR